MNFMEDVELESVSLFLTERELNNTILNGKIEAYSIRNPILLPDIPESKPFVDNLNNISTTEIHPTQNLELKSSNVNSNNNNSIENNCNNIDDVIFNLNNNRTKSRSRSNSCTSETLSINGLGGRPKDVKRSSSLGDLNTPSSKQLFFNLISTLNESFPDYDFQSTKLDQFIEMDVFSTMRSINSSLVEITEIYPNFLEKLWHSIDQCVVCDYIYFNYFLFVII